MGKTDRIVIIIAFLLLAAIGTLALYSNRQHTNDAVKASVQAQSISSRFAKMNASSVANASRIANEDFYQKLREGRTAKILVIGDDIAGSACATDGNKWTDQLTDLLHKEYRATFTVDIAEGGGIVGTWAEYNRLRMKNTTEYDCIILCTGQYDQNFDLQPFHMFYEDLLTRMMHDYPRAAVFPILESSFQTENGYTVDLRDLSSYYGLDLIDMPQAYAQSGKNVLELNKDTYHPNDVGYGLYAQAIQKAIAANVKSKEKAGYAAKPLCYSNSGQISSYTLITKPDHVSGFKQNADQQNSNGYVSTKKGSTISFKASGNLLYAYCLVTDDGGSYQVNVDDQYAGKFSTKSGVGNNVVFLDVKLTSGMHTVKFIASGSGANILGIVGQPS